MLLRRFAACAILLAVLLLTGCGGGNNPINEGQDMPVHPKKNKDKDK